MIRRPDMPDGRGSVPCRVRVTERSEPHCNTRIILTSRVALRITAARAKVRGNFGASRQEVARERRRRAFVITDAELRLMANAANMGDSSQPVTG